MATKGRYTTGRSMADVRRAIIAKGNRMNGQVFENCVYWEGPSGLKAFIKSMDERAAKRAYRMMDDFFRERFAAE